MVRTTPSTPPRGDAEIPSQAAHDARQPPTRPSDEGVIHERRAHDRVGVEHTAWPEAALLRPGRDVTLVNLSAGGALVHSRSSIAPNAQAELHLLGDHRRHIRGHVTRSHVVRLSPICYEAAIVFAHRLQILARDERDG